MNSELIRLYKVCRAAGSKASRSLERARCWIESAKSGILHEIGKKTKEIKLVDDATIGIYR